MDSGADGPTILAQMCQKCPKKVLNTFFFLIKGNLDKLKSRFRWYCFLCMFFLKRFHCYIITYPYTQHKINKLNKKLDGYFSTDYKILMSNCIMKNSQKKSFSAVTVMCISKVRLIKFPKSNPHAVVRVRRGCVGNRIHCKVVLLPDQQYFLLHVCLPN